MSSPHWEHLVTHLKEIATLGSVNALLSWDQETYMPEGAIQSRSEQCALLSKLAHERLTGSAFKTELANWINLETGTAITACSEQQSRMLSEIYRDWKLATCLPTEFVESSTKAKALSQHAWQNARQANRFEDFLPHLKTVISISRETARYFGTHPSAYNTLLDLYEPGTTTDQLDPIFDRLKTHIMALLNQAQSQPKPAVDLKTKHWDETKQKAFGHQVLLDMGYDFSRGRLDISTHPFSTNIHATDVRITTRYSTHDILDGLSSSMHEAGHALYEQGLDPNAFGTPLGQANSFGIHESQSRLWENAVGKSHSFWQHYYPKLQELFPENLSGIALDTFYQTVNHVEPSLIRVESDELTYNLHIIIRYELEKQLIEGTLAPEDLPTAWNEKYTQYLGITPPNDTLGVLQDVHWSCGYFGYFPTYTLGNLYAAMLWKQVHLDLPELEAQLKTGTLLPLRQWLQKTIHQYGRCLTPAELMLKATGSRLSETEFVAYLKTKIAER